MEDRLERLESLVALQDRTIEKLNDSIYEQQQQLHNVQKQLERLAGKVREMDATSDQPEGPEAPPPHYGR
jgi:SlyX protein